MTCFNKQEYKKLKQSAKQEGDVFAFALEADDFEYNGISIAFRPAIENSNGKMLNIAVSYCSSDDTFKSKHGKYQALLKLAKGEYIQVPLAQFLKTQGADATANLLIEQLALFK